MSKTDLLKSLKLMVHPYVFVLKEGTDIDQNFLDYSLMMLKVGPTECIPSPKEYFCEPKLPEPAPILETTDFQLKK